jgi:riboflavin biosynthesis pyrimidine reductase
LKAKGGSAAHAKINRGSHVIIEDARMTVKVLSLYPQHAGMQAVKGLYLAHRLHELGTPTNPFVYANFVSSLDGRIAIVDAEADALDGLTSANDFRLFQELHAQADCLITHTGYMRALAEGRLGNVLQVNATGQAADLAQWRRQNGLPPQPAIVIASASLDFPIHPSIAEHAQSLHIATGRSADPARVERLREQGLTVIVAGGAAMVEGAPLVRALSELRYKSIYLVAGPKMLETMLRERALSRLYLTIRHRLLGGERFHTLIDGPRLGEPGELALRSLYHDAGEEHAVGQWFAQFEPVHR